MNQVIDRIHKIGTTKNKTNTPQTLQSTIEKQMGAFISMIIKNDLSIKKTLEISSNYGFSALHVCSATKDRPGAHHTIIDPIQTARGDRTYIQNLSEAGIAGFHLVEKRSEFALPELAQTQMGQFDFIFLDGWHTFDHSLLDCHYATRLLRVGGYLVVGDLSVPSVLHVVDFIKSWPCYNEQSSLSKPLSDSRNKQLSRLLLSSISRQTWEHFLAPRLCRHIFQGDALQMIALKKVCEDKRDWHWLNHRFP